MNAKSLNILATLMLLMPHAHAANSAITQTKDGVTVTAQALTLSERNSLGKCMDFLHVFPVRLSITNNSKKSIEFNCNSISISKASILTYQGIESSISNWSLGSLAGILLFFPIGFLGMWHLSYLEEIRPIIQQLEIERQTIQPGQTFETTIFPQLDIQKDDFGKVKSFVAPASLSMKIDLPSKGTFIRSNTHTFSMTVPL